MVMSAPFAMCARSRSPICLASCWPSASRFTTYPMSGFASAASKPCRMAPPSPVRGPSVTVSDRPYDVPRRAQSSWNALSPPSSTMSTSNCHPNFSSCEMLSATSCSTASMVSVSLIVASSTSPRRNTCAPVSRTRSGRGRSPRGGSHPATSPGRSPRTT